MTDTKQWAERAFSELMGSNDVTKEELDILEALFEQHAAEEREECARIVESKKYPGEVSSTGAAMNAVFNEIATAIRESNVS